MPEMLSLRNFRLSSTLGHTVVFEANTPRFVPEPLIAEALAAGCVVTNAADQPFIDDTLKPKFEFEGDIRRSVVYMAVQSVAEENKTKNFDAGGTPKASVIATRVGFDPSPLEISGVYKRYRQDVAENTDPVLHPKAALVLRVVDATGSQDLSLLAGEVGVTEAEAASKTTRELRSLLLTKLIGQA